MRAKNIGAEPLTNITAELQSAPTNITIINSKVYFDYIAANDEILSKDTFVVIADRIEDVNENQLV